jgi:hypothetical protein
MLRLFKFSLIPLLLSACDSDDNCFPETIIAEVLENQEILETYYDELDFTSYSIENGGSMVFSYLKAHPECENTMDDERVERLSFELMDDIDDFQFIDDELVEIKCFYRQDGAWVSHGHYPIENGTISGEKLDQNTWRVTVSVTTTPLAQHEEPRIIEFMEVFKK